MPALAPCQSEPTVVAQRFLPAPAENSERSTFSKLGRWAKTRSCNKARTRLLMLSKLRPKTLAANVSVNPSGATPS